MPHSQPHMHPPPPQYCLAIFNSATSDEIQNSLDSRTVGTGLMNSCSSARFRWLPEMFTYTVSRHQALFDIRSHLSSSSTHTHTHTHVQDHMHIHPLSILHNVCCGCFCCCCHLPIVFAFGSQGSLIYGPAEMACPSGKGRDCIRF